MTILTADWHLTSNPDEEYRWQVVEWLYPLLKDDQQLYILGDLGDRRDRHPAALVNRLVDTLTNEFAKQGVEVTILAGNHDRPLYEEKPFWSFLNAMPGITFIREPTARGRQLMLPSTARAMEDWQGIEFRLYRAAFLHQSLDGADIGHGKRYRSRNKPLAIEAPRGFKFYSGDIHTPQTIPVGSGIWTYVGAPHPVRFGDDHRCRFLVIDNESCEIIREVPLMPIRKHVLEITSAADLQRGYVRHGDSARVRLVMPLDRVEQWPAEQAAITQWAQQHGVSLAGIEPIVETSPQPSGEAAELTDPEEAMMAFAEAEGIDIPLLEAGFDLLEEAKGIVL
jgi:hypothetical protein